MARSNSAHLDALKTARDAIVDGIAAGRLTIEYTIRGRTHVTSDPVNALKNLEASIAIYESKVARDNRQVFRVASLRRPRGRCA
jgi:hypothetical protein